MAQPERTTACAIDLALRHTAALFWTSGGFEWQVFSTSTAPPKADRKPYEATYHAQECAEELADWMRDTVLARDDLAVVAVELATHAKSSGALSAMMLARGGFASIGAALRRRNIPVEFVVQQDSRTAVLAERPKAVRISSKLKAEREAIARRLKLGPDQEAAMRAQAIDREISAANRQREENREQVKADVKRHVLQHFPELRAVERSVGTRLEEHVLDAASVMVAASHRPSFADAITGARLVRLRNAFVNHHQLEAAAP